MNFGKFQRSWR